MDFKQHKSGMYEVWFYAKDLSKIVEMVQKLEAFKAEDAKLLSEKLNEVNVAPSH